MRIERTILNPSEIARKYKKKVLRKGGVYKGGLELENQEYEVVESEDCLESRHKFAGTMIKVVQRIGESPKITCEPYNKNKESLLTQNCQEFIWYAN